MDKNFEYEKIIEELLRKDKLLSAVAGSINELVKNVNFSEAIINAFNIIGKVIDVNRIVLFENIYNSEINRFTLNYKYEWVSDPVYKQLDNPMLQNMTDEPPPEVANTLLQKKPLIANVKDLNSPIRELLEMSKICSVMLLPIHIREHFWGFVGFDDCINERNWTESEKAILLSFAASIASIIERKQADKNLLSKDKLLSAVAEATNEFVKNLDFDNAILNAFEILGNVLKVDRIVLFENKINPDNNEILTNHKYEWISHPQYSQKGDTALQNIPIAKVPAVAETLCKKIPLIANTKDLESVMRDVLEKHDVRSIMLFPIYLGDYFWGYTGFDDCKNERTWNESEKATLLSFAASLASIIERKQKRDQEKQTAEREKVLREVIETIRTSLDINEIKNNIVNAVGKFFNADRCFIFGYDPSKNSFPMGAEYISSPKIRRILYEDIFEISHEFVLMNKSGKNNIITDSEKFIQANKESFPVGIKFLQDYSIKSDYGFGIFYKNVFYGSLVVHFVKEKRYLTEDELKFLELFVNQAGVALYQAQLYNDLRQKVENEKTLRQIMLSNINSFKFEDIVNSIVTDTGKLFKSDRCFFIEIDSDTDSNLPIKSYAEYLSSRDILTHRSYELTRAETGGFIELVKLKKIITVDDIEKINLSGATRYMLDFLSVKSCLIAPVYYGKTLYGTIVLHYVNEYKEFTQNDINIAQAIAYQSAIILRQAELYAVIKQTTEKIEAILNNIDDGVITINKCGIIETVNPAAESMFGYSASELIGNSLSKLFPHTPCIYSKTPDCMTHKNCFVRKNVINSVDYDATKKDGSSFYIEVNLNEINVEGETIGVLMIHDITQRKKVEKLKSEFISTVNHELRTPLTSIQGSLGLILSNAFGEIPEKAKELLNMANNNSFRLINLINDILDIEKIEAGRMDFDKRIHEITPIVYQAIDENRFYAEKYNVNFKMEKNIETARVLTDKNRLIQVITNLLSNAAKFSPTDSEVKVIIEKIDDNIRVSVADKGPGIPEESKKRIFKKFSQIDSSDSRAKGGTGLGLSICKAIIEKLGGKIGFESEVGKGSVFYFDLPEYIEQSVEKVEDLGKYRVLVCEDDKDVASLIEILLKQIGCEVHIAKNAQETVNLLAVNNYKAITLDLILPDQNETYMLEYLSNREETKNLPIIVVSVKPPQNFSEVLIRKCKIIDWIEKPINHERLINSIKTTLKVNGSSKKIK